MGWMLRSTYKDFLIFVFIEVDVFGRSFQGVYFSCTPFVCLVFGSETVTIKYHFLCFTEMG